jgi:hypothetical protein
MTTCPNCASIIAYPRPNCPSCWAALDPGTAPTQAAHSRSLPSASKHWLLAAVAVVVVLVAIVATVKLLPSASQASRSTAAVSRVAQPHPAAPVADGAVTPAVAQRIARRWFIRRDVARLANDDVALGRLETGVALNVDRGFTRSIACGCEPPKHSHVLDSVKVVVPRTHSPVFLARFFTTASNGFPAGYTVVFIHVAATWKATLIAFDGRHTTIAARPRPTSGTAPDGRSVIVATAAYLRHWMVTGSAPRSSLTWTGIAKTAGPAWAALDQDQVDPKTGVRWHYTSLVEPTAYTFLIAGGTLTCGVIDQDGLASVVHGLLLQNAQRHQWGPTVAPGTYPTLLERTALQTCVISRPHRVRDLLSTYGSQVSIRPGPGATLGL